MLYISESKKSDKDINRKTNSKYNTKEAVDIFDSCYN